MCCPRDQAGKKYTQMAKKQTAPDEQVLITSLRSACWFLVQTNVRIE